MSDGRKKSGATKLSSTGGMTNPVTSGTSAPPDVLPIGDPFERMLTTPKESLIQRAASPRRNTASPLKSKGNDACLEQLPKLSGNVLWKIFIIEFLY